MAYGWFRSEKNPSTFSSTLGSIRGGTFVRELHRQFGVGVIGHLIFARAGERAGVEIAVGKLEIVRVLLA